ncbi:MAG: GntR family transcriptional regulator [Verrucomicrobia bacterium]|nr:GntR family transcriptional regulator [Verrucomicrobiota bacterium]
MPPSARSAAASFRFNLQEFRDLCGTRQALECYAAGLAAERQVPARLALLHQALAGMRRALATADGPLLAPAQFEIFLQADLAFHHAIIALADNRWLAEEVSNLGIVHRVVAIALLQGPLPPVAALRPVVRDHQEIYDAIARGDAPAARAAMAGHLASYDD